VPDTAEPLSSVALTEQCLKRIAARDARLRAFIHVTADEARHAAQASDRRRLEGVLLGGLDGVPVAIKDNIDLAGLPTSGGIGHYAQAVARRDAAIVRDLRAAGAVIVGKTNLHEAALGATSDNPWFGRCDNPLRAGFTPGGSSGGSAAAVADAMCVLAIGTDTMGSVRIPAAYCGVAGFKPTRGALPLEGVMPLSPTLDTPGLLAGSAALIAGAWQALGAPATTVKAQADGWRLGLACDFPDAQSADLALLMQSAAAGARRAGFAVAGQSLAALSLPEIRRAAFVLCEIEGAAVHAAALAADPDGFSPHLCAMLGYGARQTPERASQLRECLRLVTVQIESLLHDVDALLLPTTPQAAFAHGTPVPENQADFTVLANVAGLPAISIPWGADAAGMPLGLQLVGRVGTDSALLELAAHLEATRSLMS
jgi:aspartyl-tRNA(Asn)/glutamyl-tRNA(Gln) amidotransferase subunit A